MKVGWIRKGWRGRWLCGVGMVPVFLWITISLSSSNGKEGHHHPPSSKPSGKTHQATPTAPDDKPIRMKMDKLHEHGGVPPGWTFRFPKGDREEGRKVFTKLECYTCHKVAGEKFPNFDPKPTHKGPELTGMGGHHPIEYFLESVVFPNRIIVEGPGYVGKDGLSIMPSYNHLLTVEQLIDLGAYLKSMRKGGHAGPESHSGHPHGH